MSFETEAVADLEQPLDKLSHPWKPYLDHYEPGSTKHSIANRVYGGFEMDRLFPKPRISFRGTPAQIADRRLDIEIGSGDDDWGARLTLRNVSIRQFLVSGLGHTVSGVPTWDGEDHWEALDPQSRLELCHSEISRWSIFFKRNGELQGIPNDQAPGEEAFRDIELINNCTTADGFELRLRTLDGTLFHGSFGFRLSTKFDKPQDLYTRLSCLQAGSRAHQSDLYLHPGKKLSFGWAKTDIYHSVQGWGSGQDTIGNGSKLRIDLDRYRRRTNATVEVSRKIAIQPATGSIDYARWGRDAEYYTKPLVRGLVKSPEGPPRSFAQVRDAASIELPNFGSEGLYRIHESNFMRGYRWLHELDHGLIRRMSNGRFELELRRRPEGTGYQLRRVVFGDLDLSRVPVYDPRDPGRSNWTLHRFGFGARPTTMPYVPDFVPPGESAEPELFAYLLAGSAQDAGRAVYYVCPESFGVERAIFSWTAPTRTELTVDLISFERIVPVWQGAIRLPAGFVPEADD